MRRFKISVTVTEADLPYMPRSKISERLIETNMQFEDVFSEACDSLRLFVKKYFMEVRVNG